MPLAVRPRGSIEAATLVGGFVLLYVGLDWISDIGALPGTDYTPWNPPPALSLALLLKASLVFAPAIFLAEFASALAHSAFQASLSTVTVSATVVMAGWASAAALLRRLSLEEDQPITIRILLLLLATVAGGALVVALADVWARVALGRLPMSLAASSIRNSFIGDFSGVLSLLPALLTCKAAWRKWRQFTLRTRAFELVSFAGVSAVSFALSGLAAFELELTTLCLLLPPALWIAARRGLSWCAMAILLQQVMLLASAAAIGLSNSDYLSCQMVFVATAIAALILGAAVTQLQRAQSLARRSRAPPVSQSRLAVAGTLGASLVHEINQPLGAAAAFIHTGITLLNAPSVNRAGLRDALKGAEQATDRACALIQCIRDRIKRSEANWGAVDLAELVRRIAASPEIDERDAKAVIKVVAPPRLLIEGDAFQIELAISNLLRNALEAPPGASNCERRVLATLSRASGLVRLSIADNAAGVSACVTARLFDPFVTTKAAGTGIGLALSREIVETHGGELKLDRTGAFGSTFVLTLPERRPVDAS